MDSWTEGNTHETVNSASADTGIPADAAPRGRAAAKRSGRPDDLPRDGLNRFLGELKSLPPLEPAEVVALIRGLRAEEARFRDAIVSVPGTAMLLLERWRERQAQGRVTGMLFHSFRDESGDWSTFIDERLGLLARLVERRDELVATGAASERSALDAEITSVLASANILFEVLQEIAHELRAVLDQPRRRTIAQRRRLGLDAAAANALARAENALEARSCARQTMASHNLRLVVHVAKRYRGQGVPFLDLIQEGAIGLLRAVDKFDVDRGFRFSTYGVWWVEQAVIRAIQKDSRTVRVPSNVHELHLRYRDALRQLESRQGTPSRADLALALGISEAQVARVATARRRIHSLDAAIDAADGTPLRETLTTSDEPDPGAIHDTRRMQGLVRRGLRELEPRERQVLEWRFGLGDEESLTLQEIGVRLGLSRERARQIQNEALANLRNLEPIRGLAGAVSGEASDD